MRILTRTLATLAAAAAAGLPAAAQAEIGLGADVVSRYVWRGADFGNSVSVQPGIAWSAESFEIGAWSSWAISDGAANENDLYASYSTGPVSVTVTDYYFPVAAEEDLEELMEAAMEAAMEDHHEENGDDSAPPGFFDYSDEDGAHILEASVGVDLGMASVLAAFNFYGDADDSFWVEASVPLEALSGDAEVGLTVGGGNGFYTSDGDPALVSVSLDVGMGDYFGSYILNPDAEISFLVFGRSF